MYADTLFTTEKMIKDHPDTVRKFVRASIDGWVNSFQNPEKAINYVLKANSSLDREHQLKFLELSQPLIASPSADIGKSDPNEWEKMQNLLIEFGFLEKKVDLNNAFTNEYLQ